MSEPAQAVLGQDVVQRIATLRVRARRAVEGVRSGIHRSPHRGASVIFAEHRDYRPGDDLRLLDWRAFARNDRYTIKHFEQETHLRAHLIFDVSPSMAYDGGVAATHKRDYAATLLAAMAFILLGQGDAVGVHAIGSGVLETLPARARPGQLDAILRLLGNPPESDGATSLQHALTACAERVGRRGLVVIASDLLDYEAAALEPLTRLRALGHDVIVFHVLHPDELDFPFEQRSRFVDPEGDASLDTDAEAIRHAYLSRLTDFIVSCRQRCTAAGARYVLARTDVPVQQVVSAVLAGRGG
ncbi:MAG: DUF58 domain-containing protein [Myxococcales bacterium]|nr:DUF58 domain-containing protein [Myxococcales bacterium]